MILDDAKVVRKAREQQREEERQYDRNAFPTAQETALPGPPAYQPNPSTSSAVQTNRPTNHGVQSPLPRQLQCRANGDPESGSQPQPPPKNGGSPRMRFFKAFVVA
jgi:hypothetical protein